MFGEQIVLSIRYGGWIDVNDQEARNWARYGRFETIFNLEHLGRLWQLRYPNGPRIGIGEPSLRGGGDISGHASHETGLDVDIRPMRSDGREEGVTWKQTPTYSRQLTQELIDLIPASGTQRVQHIFFNDPKARPSRQPSPRPLPSALSCERA